MHKGTLAAVTGFMLTVVTLSTADAASPITSPTRQDPVRPDTTEPSQDPKNNTSGDLTLVTPSEPISPPPRMGLFPAFGTQLLDRGIDIHGVAFDHFLANPNTGVNPGQTNNLGVIAPAVDLDLNRLVGIPGATVRIQGTFFGLKSDIPKILSDTGGFLGGFQTTPAPLTTLLSVLTWEQKALDNRLSIEVGRTNVYRNFFLPNSLDTFTNFSSTVQIVGDFNSNPYPVWAGRARFNLTPAWYLQAGAFEDNYRRAVNNGNNFGATGASGATVIGELGYRTEFNTAAYPANLETGFLWNARTDDPTNLKGTGRNLVPGVTATNYASGGVAFVQGLQTVWRGAAKADGPPTNIALYGSFNVAVGKPQPIDLDTIAGVNFTGFIPGRPFDALGLQVHYQRLSAIESNFETRVERRFAGPGIGQPRDGFNLEAVGNIQITPAIALRPFVEYLAGQDEYYNPLQKKRARDGFEAGAFLTVSLGRLLGTSQKPF